MYSSSCPITLELFRCPVIAADGHTYEYESIRRWLNQRHPHSPLTSAILPSKVLVHNHALRGALIELTRRARHSTSGHGRFNCFVRAKPDPLVPPRAFICPITHALMSDPVATADGQSYEHGAIQQWLTNSNRSPLTGSLLSSKTLIRNHTLRSAVNEWLRAHALSPVEPQPEKELVAAAA